MFTQAQLNDTEYLSGLRAHDFKQIRTVTELTALVLAADVEQSEALWSLFEELEVAEFMVEPSLELANLLKVLANLQYFHLEMDAKRLFERANQLRHNEFYDVCADAVAVLVCRKFDEAACIAVVECVAQLDNWAAEECCVRCLREFLREHQNQTVSIIIECYQRTQSTFFVVVHTMLCCKVEIPEFVTEFFRAAIVEETERTVVWLAKLVSLCAENYDFVFEYIKHAATKASATTQRDIFSALIEQRSTQFEPIALALSGIDAVKLQLLELAEELGEAKTDILGEYILDEDQAVCLAALGHLHEVADNLDPLFVFQAALQYDEQCLKRFEEVLEQHSQELVCLVTSIERTSDLEWYAERLQARHLQFELDNSAYAFPDVYIRNVTSTKPVYAYAMECAIGYQTAENLVEKLFSDIQTDIFIVCLLTEQERGISERDYVRLFTKLMERLESDPDYAEDDIDVPDYTKEVTFGTLELLSWMRKLYSVTVGKAEKTRRQTLTLQDLDASEDVVFDYTQVQTYERLSQREQQAVRHVFVVEVFIADLELAVRPENDIFTVACACESLIEELSPENTKILQAEQFLAARIRAVTEGQNTLSRKYENDEEELKYVLLLAETALKLTEKSPAHHFATQALIPLFELIVADFEISGGAVKAVADQSYSLLGSEVFNMLYGQMASNMQLPKMLSVIVPFIALVRAKLLKTSKTEMFSYLPPKTIQQGNEQLEAYCKQYVSCYDEKSRTEAKCEQMLPAYSIYYIVYIASNYLALSQASSQTIEQVTDLICEEFGQICLADPGERQFAIACLGKIADKQVVDLPGPQTVFRQVCDVALKTLSQKAQDAERPVDFAVSYPAGLFGK